MYEPMRVINWRPLSVTYVPLPVILPLAEDVLAAIEYGNNSLLPLDPRCVRVGLVPLHGAGLVELWRGSGPVHTDCHGAIRYSHDNQYLFGVIEIDERQFTDIRQATSTAYAAILAFQQQAPMPYLLRMWNYLDGITQGVGDEERYRLFCVGRAEGLGTHALPGLPAATAIGRRDEARILQVYWLASNRPGQSIENPRQISAFHYPRQYGPTPPRFARAMLTAAHDLLISGTASIIGHATHHDGDVVQQCNETLTNIDSLIHQVHLLDNRVKLTLEQDTLLKVYLRHAADTETVHRQLQKILPKDLSFLILNADICRHDLLLEIDGLHRRSQQYF